MNLKFDWDLLEMGTSASCGISCMDGLHGAAKDSFPRWSPHTAGKLVLAASSSSAGAVCQGHLHQWGILRWPLSHKVMVRFKRPGWKSLLRYFTNQASY